MPRLNDPGGAEDTVNRERHRFFAAAQLSESEKCSPMILRKPPIHLTFGGTPASTCVGYFLLLRIRDEEQSDPPASGELVQFQVPHSVYEVTYSARAK